MQNYSQLEAPPAGARPVDPATTAALASLHPLDDLPPARARYVDPVPNQIARESVPPPVPTLVDGTPFEDPELFPTDDAQVWTGQLARTAEFEALPAEERAELEPVPPNEYATELAPNPAGEGAAAPKPLPPNGHAAEFDPYPADERTARLDRRRPEAVPHPEGSVAPVERAITESSPPSPTSWAAWAGWAAAAVLLAAGVGFYALGHLPVQRELEAIRQFRAKQLAEQSAMVANLRAELERERERERAQNAQLAAVEGSSVSPVVEQPAAAGKRPSEPRPGDGDDAHPTILRTSESGTRREQAHSESAMRKAEREDRAAKKSVDRAAAAAATAALEAEAYGRPAPATSPEGETPAKPSAPESHTKDSLSNVVNSDDDPLQGL